MSFNSYALFFDVLDDSGTPVTSLRFIPRESSSPPTESLMTLGISRDEYDTLFGLLSLDSRYSRTIILTQYSTGVGFIKYKIGLQGLKNDGTYGQEFPVTDIFVYTVDQLMFFSDSFSSDEPLPSVYLRNYEEGIGAEQRDSSKCTAEFPVSIQSVDTSSNEIIIGKDVEAWLAPGDEINIEKKSDGSFTQFTVQITTLDASGKTHVIVTSSLAGFGANDQLHLQPKSWEDHFIDLDRAGISGAFSGTVEMKAIVASFISAVGAIANDANAKTNLEAAISSFAPQILERARLYVNNVKPDDRILYWARIKMEVALKSHPFVLQSFSARNDLVQLFEELSRGYTSVDFSAAPGSAKKLLITGFDPFSLGDNPLQANPSGPCALSLHGKLLNTGTKQVFIQALVVPVRYKDFENGIIDDYVAPLIGGGPGKADMVLTISQSKMGNCNIDRFATINRNGYSDNLNETRPPNSHSVELSTSEFDLYNHIETTLPKAIAQILGETGDPVPDTWKHTTVYAQHYSSNAGTINLIPEYPDYGLIWDASIDNLKLKNPSTVLTRTKKFGVGPFAYMEEGSGSSYLSNEIFYRVALAREKWQAANPTADKFPTGHFHIPWIQDRDDMSDIYEIMLLNDDGDETGQRKKSQKNPKRTRFDEETKIINTVEDRIKRAIESFNGPADLF
jgi:hypothetical protein